MKEWEKKKLDEHYRIKFDIECVFFFLLNSKTKYIYQTPTVDHIIYKTHKSTKSDLNMKIVIAILLLDIKCKFPSLVVANLYGLGLDETIILEVGWCH